MRRTVCLVAVVAISLLCCLSGCSSKAAAQPVSDTEAPLITEGKGLFRSHEFRSTLKALPDWLRVMESANRTSEQYLRCDPAVDICSAAALSWQKIIRQVETQPAMVQLRQVNSYFNRWPYRLDQDVYGVSDYWAAPEEFLRLSGDCEDYSIAKYYALRALGFPDQSLRIVLLKDTIRNIAHAVLAVELDNERYILDNMSDLILPHRQYEHYVPQYSVNESYRWAHIAPSTIY